MTLRTIGGAILLAILAVQPVVPAAASTAPSPSVTISVSPSNPVAPYNFTVFGNVTVGSGSVSGTSVALQILASNGSLVESAAPPVKGTGTSGTYFQNFTTAPSTVWAGDYIARATYSFGGTTASASVNFTVAVCVCGLATTTVTSTASPILVATSVVFPTVAQNFVSRYPSPISVYMWVDVMDSSGQTVGVYLGSATLETNVTATIQAALFNLPTGTYFATVFVTTIGGIVVSYSSTTPSFTI